MRWATVGSGDQKGARDLLGRQAADQAQRQCDARLGGKQRMAGCKDEPQQVVADVVVERGIEVRRRTFSLGLDLATELGVLAFDQLLAAQPIDGAMFRGGHQPGARLVGNARLGPLLECGDEGVLRQLLGNTDVTHEARQAGDEPCLLDPPDRVDGAMCIDGRHGHRSQHLRPTAASPRRRHFFPISSTNLRWCSTASLAPKSSSSKICRISMSLSSFMGLGQRLIHSIASCFDFTCRTQ